jgi:two-component system, OmpR family, sensor kinase
MTRSFRFQLAARATMVAVLGLAALSAATMLALQALLDREVDASILNVASIQAASLADGPSGEMHFHEWELTPDEAASVRDLVQYVQVWNADGVRLLRSQYMTSDLPVDAEALALATAGELVWTGQDFEGAAMRTLFYPLERLGEAHEAHVLQVAAPLTRRNGMLQRTGIFLAILSAMLAAATFGGSWWLAGSAVRPIHEVIDQAESIEARSLDLRIDAYADTLEYARLVDVLNTMLARLQAGFEAQRRFTADASHELRSPLTAMRGEIEVALRRDREAGEYVGVLESTLEEVIRLSQLSEDLLTLARSDARTLLPSLESVDATEVVARVMVRLGARAEEGGVAIRFDSESPVSATVDPGVLSQIAWNLADNALRFTPSGGEVRLAVRAEPGQLVLIVEDSGPGLGSGEPTAIFERFFRGDPARTQDPNRAGTGLGLAIVHALVEAHGGSIRAEDREGGAGARFTATLSASPKVGASA